MENSDSKSGSDEAKREAKLEAARAYSKVYYEANKERKRAASKAHYQANKEKRKEYARALYAANREKMLANDSEYWRSKLEENRAKSRAKYYRNRERDRDKKRASYFRQSIEVRQATARHHYVLNRTSIKYCWRSGRSAAKRRDYEWNLTLEQYAPLRELPCHYCGGPLNPTGSALDRKNDEPFYTIENVVPCCGRCNSTFIDGFTYEEKLMIAETLKQIDVKRLSSTVEAAATNSTP